MKLRVQNAPAKLMVKGLFACLVDRDTFFFKGLPPHLQNLAKNYQAHLRKNEAREPLLIALPDEKPPAFLLMAAPEILKYYTRAEAIKTVAFYALKKAEAIGAGELSFLVNTADAKTLVPLLSEGIVLGAYRFDRYLTKDDKKEPAVSRVNFLCIPNQRLALEKSVREIEALGVAINGAREITNEPGGVITPEALARHAKKLAANSYKRGKLTCRILNEKALKKWGYNGLLTVGAGAPYPPRLIALTYKPAKGVGNVHLCVVGKGVTFDTGGVCLKKPKQMWEMKTDMAGAASALHTAEAAARLSIPAKITAIVPAAQNTIGANAALPGTIFRAKNGKTIHVDNTDAEGRLILTDAFALAESLKPTHLVDLATLTGSCILALGTSLTGLLGDNHDFNKTFLEIAEAVGEPCWELPLFEEYKKHLKCDFADINNIANTPNAGAISAALFLAEFKPKDVPWIHLDIAGTAMAEKEWKYFRPGATGVGIRSLVRLARHLARR